MKVRVVIVSSLLLLLLPNQAGAASTATKEKQQEPTTHRPWLVDDYPHPDKKETDHQHQQQPSCRSRSQSKRFCDPDGIVQTPADLERLDEALRVVVRSRHVCPDDAKDEHEKEHGVEVQFAVAFVDKV
jgi:hypothetical protein